MLPLRLVIDTDVLVSAALKPEGLQRTALVLAVTKPARFYVSHPILEESAAVLSRPQLDIRGGVRLQLLALIRNHSYIVSPSRRLEVAGDPDDNMFLECAMPRARTTSIPAIRGISRDSGRRPRLSEKEHDPRSH
ncbi:MAG TPA: putative toxin-antitoxin system toxin component, PIN family [Candidatus Polarisedimenticolia bacterium]|nr:putative toxin-antitoxin system toxin component, PIN family [Candidatus Polarisedimenticolia bacterium]